MLLKELRKSKNLTQMQASALTGIPLRTYKNYENDESKQNSIKYEFIMNVLNEYAKVDETHGVLSFEEIKEKCREVFKDYPVDYAVLFGSYAKGNANELSDVDLLVVTEITGLKFYGLAERLRQSLNKKVDLLDLNQLKNNSDLVCEILKTGKRIYEG